RRSRNVTGVRTFALPICHKSNKSWRKLLIMGNLRDIRYRIDSIKNTRQITPAIKMVAAAKLPKAQDHIIQMRPYASKMKDIVARLVDNSSEEHELLKVSESIDEVLFIVI